MPCAKAPRRLSRRSSARRTSRGCSSSRRTIGERVVVGVPAGESGDTLRLLVQRNLGETDLVLTGSEEELILFREWSGLRLAAVDPLGPAGQEAYQCLLATENYTPHSRLDVSFELPR